MDQYLRRNVVDDLKRTAVELAAQRGCEAADLVRLAVHGRVDHILVFDDKSYLGIAVTLETR